MRSTDQMASSGPTGTIPVTTEAALEVLRHRFGDERFRRNEAIESLLDVDLSDDPFDVEDPAATRLRNCSREDADSHIQILLENGYLYAIGDELRITPE
jgi:hypothetical protein